MKLFRFLGGVAICAASTSLLVSCQKDETPSPTLPQVENTVRLSGVVEDNPAIVAKIPMIVSNDFLLHGKSLSEPVFSARGKPDNAAPTVSIVSPANASTVSGLVNVQVSAADNVGVTSVSLSVDGTLISSDNSSPYMIPWNSQTAANGSHTLMVTARDAAGNSRSVSIQVLVNNTATGDNVNPIVNITSPTNNSSVAGTVTVTATATDNVGVSSVIFSVDGNVLGTDNNTPFNFAWNTANTANGIRTLTATATDAAGNSSVNSMQVTVNTTVIPPAPLPTSFQLLTPTPGNQGGEGSCVAFAVGYGARSIEQFYRTNATAYSQQTNVFSPEYIYNQTKFSDCASGTSFTIVLDLIKNQGVSSWQSMPYSDFDGCSSQPNATQVANASAYKISSYATIPNTDRIAIKTMIASKHPVITNIIADNSFINAGPGFIWSSYSGSGALPHAILICGYDDTKHAYKVMNSFGTAWGDAGFSWIDYDFFTQKSSYYTYVIQ